MSNNLDRNDFYKYFGMIAKISEIFVRTSADGKLDVFEIIEASGVICDSLEIKLDERSKKVFDLIIGINKELPEILEDGKLTVKEALSLLAKTAEALEIDVDSALYEV